MSRISHKVLELILLSKTPLFPQFCLRLHPWSGSFVSYCLPVDLHLGFTVCWWVTVYVCICLHLLVNSKEKEKIILIKNRTCGAVLEGEALKGRDVGGLGDDLCVVRYGSGHRVTDDHDQLHVLRHSMDSCWCFHSNKVTRRLLHNNLSVQGFGHHTSGSTRKMCC